MMTSLPVVTPHGGVWQAAVARDIDAVSICVQLCGAPTAATVSDVTAQHSHDTIQRRGAVHDRLWCILGRQRVLEAEGNNLDSELHIS